MERSQRLAYWSYTAYPIPAGGPVAHVIDSNIAQSQWPLHRHHLGQLRRHQGDVSGHIGGRALRAWWSCASTYRSTSPDLVPEASLFRRITL